VVAWRSQKQKRTVTQVRSEFRDYVLLHLIVLVWGFTGILGKLIALDTIAIVYHRMSWAFAFLLLWLFISKKSVIPPFRSLIKMIGIGVLVALHWLAFFEAIDVSNVSVCLATISITPLFSAFLDPLFYRKRLVIHEIVLGLVVIAGVVTIFSFETEYVLGITLAVLAAFLAALFTVINSQMIKHHKATVISTWEMLGGALTVMGFIALSPEYNFKNVYQFVGFDALYIGILALICTAIAFVVSVEVMKSLSPFTVNISISMEPIYSIGLALLIFGEEEYMSGGFYLGAGVILGSVIANTLWKRHKKKRSKEIVTSQHEA